MTNQPIVILGTQRSGTTLLSLILDSHPEIHAIGETQFADECLDRYLTEPAFSPCVVFKLPRRTCDAAWVRALPDARVLWCLRDPRDVVASMLHLRIPLNRAIHVAWAIHPGGAREDIARLRAQLDGGQRRGLAEELERFDAIAAKPLVEITHREAVFCGALSWRLMNEMLPRYEEYSLPYLLVLYEELVREPRRRIAAILEHAGTVWHDDVLRHHELHSGIDAAAVDRGRPIDSASVGRWQHSLNANDTRVVESVTRSLAERLGCWR